jgi:hypothetical protein
VAAGDVRIEVELVVVAGHDEQLDLTRCETRVREGHPALEGLDHDPTEHIAHEIRIGTHARVLLGIAAIWVEAVGADVLFEALDLLLAGEDVVSPLKTRRDPGAGSDDRDDRLAREVASHDQYARLEDPAGG